MRFAFHKNQEYDSNVFGGSHEAQTRLDVIKNTIARASDDNAQLGTILKEQVQEKVSGIAVELIDRVNRKKIEVEIWRCTLNGQYRVLLHKGEKDSEVCVFATVYKSKHEQDDQPIEDFRNDVKNPNNFVLQQSSTPRSSRSATSEKQ